MKQSNQSLPVWVGITTLPSRLPLLRQTLDSLLAQSRSPDRILLCLPQWSEREDCPYPQCDWLLAYRPVLSVVRSAHDYGPGTKLLGCLPHIDQPVCFVLVDDDLEYSPEFLRTLSVHQAQNLKSSFSFWTYPYGPFVVGQGADGLSIYTPNLQGIFEFFESLQHNSALKLVDDLWISAFLHSRGVAMESLASYLPPGELIYRVVHQVNQLRALTGSMGRAASMATGLSHLLRSMPYLASGVSKPSPALNCGEGEADR